MEAVRNCLLKFAFSFTYFYMVLDLCFMLAAFVVINFINFYHGN